MYKGYKIVKDQPFYKIIDRSGKVCATMTVSHADGKSERELVSEMIRKRTPKIPLKKFDGEIKDGQFVQDTIYSCPECGSEVGRQSETYKYHHCANCGQVIGWE